MLKETERRVARLEGIVPDWFAALEVVDYLDIEDYTDESVWKEIYVQGTITVVRNRDTKEIRGYYRDRRTEAEIVEQGGDLAFL